MKGEEYSDVISSEYLNWMEDTLKSAGVDIAGVVHTLTTREGSTWWLRQPGCG